MDKENPYFSSPTEGNISSNFYNVAEKMTTSLKKVLIIAYFFPPSSSAGCFRIIRFVRHLGNCGWEPVILTASHSYNYKWNYDFSLLTEIPKNVKIYRTYSFEMFSEYRLPKPKQDVYHTNAQESILGKIHRKAQEIIKGNLHKILDKIAIPDDKVGWMPFAFVKAREIIEREKIDVVMTTGMPHSSHLIGMLLKKHLKIPWVSDFRDPWTFCEYIEKNFGNPLRSRLETYLERQVLGSADINIINTDYAREEFCRIYPEINKDKFVTITNSFDLDYFKDISREKELGGQFTITYCGSFFRQRTPYYFLMALRKLLDDNKELENRIKVIFVGGLGYDESKKKWNSEYIKELNLENQIQSVGRYSHEESLNYMVNSDMLLSIGGDISSDGLYIPGKMFEYLAAGRPILALAASPGATAELIEKTNTGYTVGVTDIDGIASKLKELYDAYKSGKSIFERNSSEIEKYDVVQTTRQLAECFNSII